MAVTNRRVSDEELLAPFRETGLPMTAPEIAGYVDISRQAVDKRLRMLAEDGSLKKKETGHTIIYWLPSAFPSED